MFFQLMLIQKVYNMTQTILNLIMILSLWGLLVSHYTTNNTLTNLIARQTVQKLRNDDLQQQIKDDQLLILGLREEVNVLEQTRK